MYELGAAKPWLVVRVAGGAQLLDPNEFFAIGKRNHMALRKILWKNGIMIMAEHMEGAERVTPLQNIPREIASLI